MTLAELKALMAGDILPVWQREYGATDDRLRDWLENGIPVALASDMATIFPSLPVSRWPRVLHGPKVLHARSQKARVNVNKVTDEHRFNIAKGQGGGRFADVLSKAKHTQRTLAAALKIPPSLLSMYRKEKRAIPRARAEEIERLTGWPADRRHWPGGIVS